jgi:amidohydrolase
MDDAASQFLGVDNIDRYTNGMGGEDFAYMQAKAPGTMISVGAAYDDMKRGHHTPVFAINEDYMPLGAAILAETARRFLAGEVK